VSWSVALLLFGGGLVGGIANALAGGATLITFPVMLAAGLPPIVANASNAVAVTPGHTIAAFADRERMPAADLRFLILFSWTALCGAVGAILLFITPERLFAQLVPLLIGVATLVFAFAPRIHQRVKSWRPHGPGSASLGTTLLLLAPSTIYGGYFGAGLGVILMAVLTVSGMEDVRAANTLKNLLAAAVSAATIVVFVVQDIVSWPQTIVMLLGAVAGGFAGGYLVRILPSHVVRRIVIVIGLAMTVIYAVRYWS
jgi:uncharacterized membrane protein YfcA